MRPGWCVERLGLMAPEEVMCTHASVRTRNCAHTRRTRNAHATRIRTHAHPVQEEHALMWGACACARTRVHLPAQTLAQLFIHSTQQYVDPSQNEWLRKIGALATRLGVDTGEGKILPHLLFEVVDVQVVLDADDDLRNDVCVTSY